MVAEAVVHLRVPSTDAAQHLAEPAVLHSDRAESLFVQQWEKDIQRCARWGAKLLGCGPDDTDDLAQQARLGVIRARRHGRVETGYVRRAIRNAVISGVRRDRRAITTTSPRGCPLDTSRQSPSSSLDDRASGVREWVTMLPPRLREVYDLLYERGFTQQQAAVSMEVSQPRVAQLHRLLLQRGSLELADMAA